MPYFDEDFLTFFKELSRNNHREWFQAHKSTYENRVREPFLTLVGDLIEQIRLEDPRTHPEARNSVFRINRDIRFSKDKSPYKLHMAAAICRGGRPGAMAEPAYYFHLSPDSTRVCVGLFRPERKALVKVRRALVRNPGELEEILSSRRFKSKWGEIRGERNKILPAEFKKAGDKNPLLFNKAYYVLVELPPESVLRRDLKGLLMGYFRSARPLHDYLWRALESRT